MYLQLRGQFPSIGERGGRGFLVLREGSGCGKRNGEDGKTHLDLNATIE